MGKVKIFSDSTCDLSPELVAQYDIGVVPVYVRFGDQVYRDGIDLTVEELYPKVDELGELPATAAPLSRRLCPGL